MDRDIERERERACQTRPTFLNYICIMNACLGVWKSWPLQARAGCQAWCLEVLASASIVQDVMPSSSLGV